MEQKYWDNSYWQNQLIEKKFDFLNLLWIEKYALFLDTLPKGKVLDLGCGIGQYTKYFLEKGHEVISADISIKALQELKKSIPHAKIKQLDMSKPLPFKNQTFDIVFANLSIHYFNKETTEKLLKEIKRILKKDGYFIGSVNSSKTFQFIRGTAIKLEENYYYDNGITVRLWDKKQFDTFFTCFHIKELHEVETTRRNKPKIEWEFIASI